MLYMLLRLERLPRSINGTEIPLYVSCVLSAQLCPNAASDDDAVTLGFHSQYRDEREYLVRLPYGQHQNSAQFINTAPSTPFIPTHPPKIARRSFQASTQLQLVIYQHNSKMPSQLSAILLYASAVLDFMSIFGHEQLGKNGYFPALKALGPASIEGFCLKIGWH